MLLFEKPFSLQKRCVKPSEKNMLHWCGCWIDGGGKCRENKRYEEDDTNNNNNNNNNNLVMTMSFNLGGGFKHLLFSLLLVEMIQFDYYFSDGLKPPPSSYSDASTSGFPRR